LRLYSNLLEKVEDNRDFLNPSWSLAMGFRADSRFQPYPGSGLPVDNLRKRWFLRSFVTLTNVIEKNNNNATAGKTNPFDVAVGVEYDRGGRYPWGARSQTVPDGVMVFINASVDLIAAFKKQGAQQGSGPTPNNPPPASPQPGGGGAP
jgi:aminopeptidase-like protein